MKMLFVLLILALFLFPQGVLANAPQGNIGKRLTTCFEISNINQYPDYKFIYYIDFTGDLTVSLQYQIIKQDDCNPLEWASWTPYNYTIGVIKATDFNRIGFTETRDNTTNYVFNSIRGENLTLLKNSAKSISFTLDDITNMTNNFNVDESDPRQKVTDVLEIVSLGDNNFGIKKSKVVYTYTDGTTEEKPYQTDSRPETSRSTLIPGTTRKTSSGQTSNNLLYIVLSAAAIIIIIAIILLRRRSKK